MVIDTLSRSSHYERLHPRFAAAFAFLAFTKLADLAPGRTSIDGDRLYISIDHTEGRGHEGAKLECHRQYIDIQIAFDGVDEIGWRPLAACTEPDGPFAVERDIGFFRDRPETWLTLKPDYFAIFFPEDAHAPLAGRGPVRKAIVKIAV